jgi:hypothetical protein
MPWADIMGHCHIFLRHGAGLASVPYQMTMVLWRICYEFGQGAVGHFLGKIYLKSFQIALPEFYEQIYPLVNGSETTNYFFLAAKTQPPINT